MSSMRKLQLSATPAGVGLPGCWTLARNRAITLDTNEPGYLHVANGAVWATLDGPHEQGQSNQWGDVVLCCDARIRLVPGQHVVLESFPAAANEEACFSWEPDAPQQHSGLSWAQAAMRRLRGVGAAIANGVGRWLEPGPGWLRYAPDHHARTRDDAWRRMYHLGINQP